MPAHAVMDMVHASRSPTKNKQTQRHTGTQAEAEDAIAREKQTESKPSEEEHRGSTQPKKKGKRPTLSIPSDKRAGGSHAASDSLIILGEAGERVRALAHRRLATRSGAGVTAALIDRANVDSSRQGGSNGGARSGGGIPARGHTRTVGRHTTSDARTRGGGSIIDAITDSCGGAGYAGVGIRVLRIARATKIDQSATDVMPGPCRPSAGGRQGGPAQIPTGQRYPHPRPHAGVGVGRPSPSRQSAQSRTPAQRAQGCNGRRGVRKLWSAR